MSDTLEIFGQEWTGVTGFKATDDNDTIKTFIRPQGTINISQNGQGIDVSQYASANVAVPSTDFIVTVSWNSSTNLYESDKTFAEIQTAYNAGKTIAVKAGVSETSGTSSSSILSADGEYHTGTTPYFDYWVREYVDGANPETERERGYRLSATGTTMHNSYTYIQPSGNLAITQNGDNIDVTNYATASVPTASFYTGEEHGFYTESNVRKWRYRGMTDLDISEGDTEGWHGTGRQYGDYKVHNAVQTATITPSTSSQTIGGANYMMEGAVTVSGDANLVSGNIKSGTTIFGVTGTYSGGGSSKNIQVNQTGGSVRTNGYTSTGVSLTVAKAGTYKVTWTAWRSSSQGTMGTNLYNNGTAGTAQQTWTSTYGQHITLNNQTYAQGDILTLYATAGSTTRYCYVGDLVIVEQ